MIEQREVYFFFEDKMRLCVIWGFLFLMGRHIVLADPEADPSEELLNRFHQPKNHKEDKCYDENGKPQVCIKRLHYLCTINKKNIRISYLFGDKIMHAKCYCKIFCSMH